jgi:hypothetical protein
MVVDTIYTFTLITHGIYPASFIKLLNKKTHDPVLDWQRSLASTPWRLSPVPFAALVQPFSELDEGFLFIVRHPVPFRQRSTRKVWLGDEVGKSVSMQDSPEREPGRVLVSEQEPVRRTSISFAPHSPTPSSDSSRSVNSPLLIREDEDEEDDPLLFPQFDDSDAESEEHDYYIPHDQRPLSPGRVVLLLTAPSLRLGAFALPSVLHFNLAISIPCLLVSAMLSLFVRHLWVMLAHYVRKVTVEDIVSELTVKFGVGRRWRKVTKTLVRTAGSTFRVILLMFYIRCEFAYPVLSPFAHEFLVSVKSLANLFPASPVAQPVIALLIFLLVAFSGSSTTSITSTPIAFAALLSAICYVVWMGFLIRATIVKDTRVSESILSILQLNAHWNTLSTLLFTFASFPPLSIHASLSTYRYPVQSVFDKKKKRNSFGALSSAATIITVALTFPLLFLVKSQHKVCKFWRLATPDTEMLPG